MAPLSYSVAMYMHAVIGVLALSTFAALAASGREGAPSRIRYPVERFDETPSTGGGSRKLVVVHAAWCGHCKTLLARDGVWSKVRKALPGVAVAEIDEADAPDLVRTLNINGFPDIRVLDGNKSVASFKGDRTADAIVEFALKHIK